MIRIDDLLGKVSSYIPDPATVGQVSKAYVYSATLHRNDFTSTGASTLQHALEVSSILADLKLDARCVVAGLVHDALEHSLAQPEALRQAIGEDAAHLVEEVSRLSRATFRGSEAARAQHMREMILASTRDLRVILLLLADRLQVLRSPQQLDPETQKALARETLAIYAPIAHRLGIHYFKAELEDRAFEILEPAGFAELQAAVQGRLRQSQGMLDRVNPELQA
ncbi:MAG TPA: HD domain-containing protein, partial [bacterium]|nr:HD domain-containing protein [bacterium]